MLLPDTHLNGFWFLFIELHQCPLFEVSLGLLALKTKHIEQKEVYISQDSWLKATAANPIYEGRREFPRRFLGGSQTISCKIRLEKWAGGMWEGWNQLVGTIQARTELTPSLQLSFESQNPGSKHLTG